MSDEQGDSFAKAAEGMQRDCRALQLYPLAVANGFAGATQVARARGYDARPALAPCQRAPRRAI